MRYILCLAFILFPLVSYGQQPVASSDSLLTHDLEEIVVSTGEYPREIGTTVQRVRAADLETQNATAVSELTRLVGSAHIQTNSRGESLVYLRNAGERQVALYFNGALLNIPWDNRMNLDMVPAYIIGGMTVAKGVPSVLYGANALGGAINLTSKRVENEGHYTDLNVQAGNVGNSIFSAAHFYRTKGWQFIVSGNFSRRDGMPVAGDAVLPFSQPSSTQRTNTDREFFSGFFKVGHQFPSGIQSNLSLFHVDGAFGIAPESHLDPLESRVRFWRYPVYRNTIAILNSVFPVNNSLVIRHALWYNGFEQQIDDFEDATYQALNEKQQDLDETVGTRLTLLQDFGLNRLSISLNGLVSSHEEKIVERDESGQIPDFSSMASTDYRQFIYSAGFEYEQRLARGLRAVIGGSFDGIGTPETGDKPSQGSLTDAGFTAGLQYELATGPWIRFSSGRRTRFPTLRELFGVALNRFLLNPDLKAESSFVSELSLAREGERFSGEAVLFYARTNDTIDQTNVQVEDRVLRQRINLEGSRNIGVELNGVARLGGGVDATLHFTRMRIRGIEDGETFFLTERPGAVGRLQVQLRRPSGLRLAVAGDYTGRAYGRQEDNALVALPRTVVMDSKVAYGMLLGPEKKVFSELYAGIDNAFDQVTLPQLGLPGQGRLLKVGIKVSF